MANPPDVTQREVIATIVSILVESLFINLAARFVIDRSSILASILTAILGSLASGVVLVYVGGTLGIVAAVAVWALVAALLFRTNWIKGAILGLVAWVLWILVVLLIQALVKA